jgi:hypothetical protein
LKLTFSHSTELLTVIDDAGVCIRIIPASSHVRNELNHKRPDASRLPDLFTTLEGDGDIGPPSMPRPYPVGKWTVTGKRTTTERWLRPVKFLTDAHQTLVQWATDDGGNYTHATDKTVEDYGYRIHFANGSRHTEGCIGVASLADIAWLDAHLTFPSTLEVT